METSLFIFLIPFAFLFLRIVLAVMFIDSGWRHIVFLKKRAKGLGLPVWFTFILGFVEIVGGLALIVGYYTHVAAFFLSGVMIGAMFFKLFVWKTGIYGKNGGGWYYDALLLAGVGMLFVLGAGAFSLDALYS